MPSPLLRPHAVTDPELHTRQVNTNDPVPEHHCKDQHRDDRKKDKRSGQLERMEQAAAGLRKDPHRDAGCHRKRQQEGQQLLRPHIQHLQTHRRPGTAADLQDEPDDKNGRQQDRAEHARARLPQGPRPQPYEKQPHVCHEYREQNIDDLVCLAFLFHIRIIPQPFFRQNLSSMQIDETPG